MVSLLGGSQGEAGWRPNLRSRLDRASYLLCDIGRCVSSLVVQRGLAWKTPEVPLASGKRGSSEAGMTTQCPVQSVG